MSDHDLDMTGIDLEAAQWIVRGQAEDFCDADMIALSGWLDLSDRHVDAYDRALRLWAQLDELKGLQEITPEVTEVVSLDAFRAKRSAKPQFRTSYMGWGGGIAAALAVLVSLPFLTAKPAQIDVYQTARGHRQNFTLADGSMLHLNTDTKVSVQFTKGERRVMLDHGEVALKVTHDEKRPLILTAGDERITDLGTEFDVMRLDGAIRVAVKEGSVNVGGDHIKNDVLKAGDMHMHQEGGHDGALSHADADEAFAWTTAHAIYHDQPLSVVVKDLNRYYDKPLIVDDQSGKIRLTAILTLDSETSVVERLQDFLPLEARTTPQGVYLKSRGLRAGTKL